MLTILAQFRSSRSSNSTRPQAGVSVVQIFVGRLLVNLLNQKQQTTQWARSQGNIPVT